MVLSWLQFDEGDVMGGIRGDDHLLQIKSQELQESHGSFSVEEREREREREREEALAP
jgi:hypothetical protein